MGGAYPHLWGVTEAFSTINGDFADELPLLPLRSSKPKNRRTMSKIGVFFGSTTGTAEELAGKVAAELGVSSDCVHNVTEMNEDLVNAYDVLVLGSSTWGSGELQDDWYDGVKVLKACDLSHKCVALFGCGDSDSYADTFCDAIGIIYEELKDSKCRFCGATSTDGYTFDSSVAVVGGKFVGLPLDEVNEDGQTDGRIAAWCEQLKQEFA